MSYLVLARKYRPQNFEQVVGQSHVTQTLKNAIEADRIAHALLFAGPRGVGKTSVARIVAKAMNCKEGPTPAPCGVCTACSEITNGIAVDVLEIDGASNRGINEIRELRESIKYLPGHTRYKIYIIDEVHMLTAEAFNALLKTLEEPPAHALFVFATTEAHKIPLTILSRCQRHDFRRVGLKEMVAHLKEICQKISFQISEEGLQLLAREADGSMRDALSLLDQAIAYSDEGTSEDQLLEILGAVDRKAIFDLASALLNGDVLKALTLLDNVHNCGHDLKRLLMQVTEHFRHLLIMKMGHGNSPLVDLPAHELSVMEQQVENTSLETINQIFTNLFQAGEGIRFSPHPKLALEMLFVKITRLKPVVSIDEIISKLDLLAGKTAERPRVTEVKEGPGKETAADRPTGRDRDQAGEPGRPPASAEELPIVWKEMVAVLAGECPTLLPNLEKASLTRIEKDFVEITVTGNSFYTKRLQDEKSISALQEVCGRFFKRNMKVKILGAKDPASKDKSRGKESDKERRLKKEALSHPLVTDALEVFQGRVIDVKIL